MPNHVALKLLPCPRSLKWRAGNFILPKHQPLKHRIPVSGTRSKQYLPTFEDTGFDFNVHNLPAASINYGRLRNTEHLILWWQGKACQITRGICL